MHMRTYIYKPCIEFVQKPALSYLGLLSCKLSHNREFAYFSSLRKNIARRDRFPLASCIPAQGSCKECEAVSFYRASKGTTVQESLNHWARFPLAARITAEAKTTRHNFRM